MLSDIEPTKEESVESEPELIFFVRDPDGYRIEFIERS